MYKSKKKKSIPPVVWALLAGADLPLPRVDERGQACSAFPANSHLHFFGSRLRRQVQAGSSKPSVGRASLPPSSSADMPPEGSEKPQAKPRPSDDDLGYLKSVDMVAFNQSAELAFVVVVRQFLRDEGQPQPMVAVLAEAAFELDISTETAKRYLIKHSARRAEFRVENKKVWLR